MDYIYVQHSNYSPTAVNRMLWIIFMSNTDTSHLQLSQNAMDGIYVEHSNYSPTAVNRMLWRIFTYNTVTTHLQLSTECYG